MAIKFPNVYPFKPPAVRFETPIWHPWISCTGQPCLRMLDDGRDLTLVPVRRKLLWTVGRGVEPICAFFPLAPLEGVRIKYTSPRYAVAAPTKYTNMEYRKNELILYLWYCGMVGG